MTDLESRRQLRETQRVKEITTRLDNLAFLITRLLTKEEQEKDVLTPALLGEISRGVKGLETITSSFGVKLPENYKISGRVDVSTIPPVKVVEAGEIIGSLKEIRSALGKIKFDFPDEFPINGSVSVTDLPPVKIGNFSELKKEFDKLSDALVLTMTGVSEVAKKQKTANVPPQENKALLGALQGLQDHMEDMHEDMIKISKKEIEFPETIAINNFPPQKIPQPVTHISINSLRGMFQSSAVTVTTAPTELQRSSPLANRRSLIVYNNSSSTIYIGDSNISTTTGLPLPANSYSPSFDAGINMVLYAITSSGTADVRICEMSDENSGR